MKSERADGHGQPGGSSGATRQSCLDVEWEMAMSIRSNRRSLVGGLGALGLLLLPAAATHAAPILKITSGSGTVTVLDNGAGDADPTPGVIHFAGPVAGFDAVDIRGSSNSPGGTLASGPIRDAGLLQLESVQARNNSAGRQVLDIVFGDTGFTPGLTNNTLTSSVGLTMTGATQGDTATLQSYYDPTNGAPGRTSPYTTGAQTAVANGAQLTQSYSSTSDTSLPSPASPTSPFSLTQYVGFDVSPLSQVNLSGTTASNTQTPEPGSLALVGIGAVTLLGRRRRKNA
jgi:hypothetical protein